MTHPPKSRSTLLILLSVGAAVAAGAMIGIQPAVNAALARHIASPFAAAFVSLTVSALVLLPFVAALGGKIDLSAAASAPWWVWIGGIAGAAFVVSGLTIAPLLGVAFFISAVVAGQLIAAALIDHFGLFGMVIRPISPWRLFGLLLTAAGVIVFRFAK